MPDKDMFMCAYPEWQEQRISTTFWMDFTIADHFGKNAIQDTFNRAFKEWKSNYKYLTELVGVLNHKLWQHYEVGNTEVCIECRIRTLLLVFGVCTTKLLLVCRAVHEHSFRQTHVLTNFSHVSHCSPRFRVA